MGLIIKEIGKNDKEVIKPLINTNRYNLYSNIGFYKETGKLNEYYYNLFFVDKKVKIISCFAAAESVGIVTAVVPKWDQEAFGIKMAIIGYITAAGDYAEALAIKKKLLDAAIKYLKSNDVKHVSVRVEANDFSSIHALESYGFKIMDNLAAYISKNKTAIFPDTGRWFIIKKIGKDDLEAAGDLLADRVVLGHYAVDPGIHYLKIRGMYKKWLKAKYNDLKNNDIFVAKRGNDIVGCSLLSFNVLLKKCTGLQSLHRALVAVKPSAAGCFFALFNAQMRKRRDMDFFEFETQTYNYNMMNMIQRLNMRLIRCRYTFHKKL